MKPEIVNGLFALGGAALGAFLTSTFSWLQNKKSQSRSELSILTSRAARLIEVDSSISEIVEIRVHGDTVPSVYTLDTRLLNTGTEPLHDGDIYIDLIGESTVLALDIPDSPTVAGDVLTVERKEDKTGFRLRFDFMNPNEDFLLRALITARPYKVVPTFRQHGVTTRIQTDHDPELPGVLARVLFEAIRQNWILHLYVKTFFQPYRRYLEQMGRERRSAQEAND